MVTSTEASRALDELSHTSLSDVEQDALRRAAVWYFKRHARIIADEADDFSARAVTDRQDFLDLHSALRKLGVPIALPDELRDAKAA
jgi:hypothetical protein